MSLVETEVEHLSLYKHLSTLVLCLPRVFLSCAFPLSLIIMDLCLSVRRASLFTIQDQSYKSTLRIVLIHLVCISALKLLTVCTDVLSGDVSQGLFFQGIR